MDTLNQTMGSDDQDVREAIDAPAKTPSWRSQARAVVVRAVERHLRIALPRRMGPRAGIQASADGSVRVCIGVLSGQPNFGYYKSVRQALATAPSAAYLAFGCGPAVDVVLVPFSVIEDRREVILQSKHVDRQMIPLRQTRAGYAWTPSRAGESVDLTPYVVDLRAAQRDPARPIALQELTVG